MLFTKQPPSMKLSRKLVIATLKVNLKWTAEEASLQKFPLARISDLMVCQALKEAAIQGK